MGAQVWTGFLRVSQIPLAALAARTTLLRNLWFVECILLVLRTTYAALTANLLPPRLQLPSAVRRGMC